MKSDASGTVIIYQRECIHLYCNASLSRNVENVWSSSEKKLYFNEIGWLTNGRYFIFVFGTETTFYTKSQVRPNELAINQSKLLVVLSSSFAFVFSRVVKSSGMQWALLACWILRFVSKISEQADLHQGWDLNIWLVLNNINCYIASVFPATVRPFIG